MEKTHLKDLEPGTVYYTDYGEYKFFALGKPPHPYLVVYKNTINTPSYYTNGSFKEDNWKEASHQNAQWLFKCIEQGKYIPLDQINLEHSYLIHN